jgi:hypothetical protein
MPFDEGLLYGVTSIPIYFPFMFVHFHSAQVFVTPITVIATLIAILLDLITKLPGIPSTAHSIDSHRSSTFLIYFELTVLELSKQNILPAVYTQPTLNVTTLSYLVRKQWCSASWLPCLIILSPGRPIFSQNREYLTEIKANESQTTKAKGSQHRSEVAETFTQYVPTSKLGPGKTLSKLRISVSLLSTYRKIPGLYIKSDYDRFLHQPFQFAAYLLLYTFHTMIITEQTNLIPTSCTRKKKGNVLES